MNDTQYAKGITAEGLRIFLANWPKLSADAEESQQMVIDAKEKLLNEETEPFAWCYLYEFPFIQHMNLVNAAIVQGYAKFLSVEQVTDWYKQIADTPGQIGAIPDIYDQIGSHFDETELSEEDAKKLLPTFAGTLGIGLSIQNSLRCVLFHGCFLNELIERVRTGDDKALFDAIRIDPTVIGCPSVSFRISKAALLKDKRFFAKLRASLKGKMAKREQANLQKMRLVFEVLHESGATRLTDSQLEELFVHELDLYDYDEIGGGKAKALRKFADTYMKKNSTT
jgi:hypothetical protein